MGTLAEWNARHKQVKSDVENRDRTVEHDTCDNCHGVRAIEKNYISSGKSLCTYIADVKYCDECLAIELANHRPTYDIPRGVETGSFLRYDGVGQTAPERSGSYAQRPIYRRTE